MSKLIRNYVTRIGWSAVIFILRETSPFYEPHYFTGKLTSKRRSVNQRVSLKGKEGVWKWPSGARSEMAYPVPTLTHCPT
jgi:hypothetical protein